LLKQKLKDQKQRIPERPKIARKLTNVPEVVEARSNSNNIMPQSQAYAAFCILNI
jgi:hypothetical protein